MTRILFLLISCFALSRVVAQDDSFLHNRVLLERMGTAGAAGNGIPLSNMGAPKPGLIGDVYLNTNFKNAAFFLFDKDMVTQAYPARLDLQRNEFDIKTKTGVRSLSGSQVKSLLWRDTLTGSSQYFVNGRLYKNDEGVPYLGFFQVMTEGDLTLLKMMELVFRPADKNPTHRVGSSDDRFIKRPWLFYARGTVAVKMPNKKGVRELFASRADEMEKFIKVNGINLGVESHLVSAFEYYNSLVKK